MKNNHYKCPCCGVSSWRPYFQGVIRAGAFGSSIYDALVVNCTECGIVRLDEQFCEPVESYKNADYRDSLKESNTSSGFYTKHDELQVERLNMITKSYRGARILDVGCAAGSFLDYVSGLASSCVAIEPCQNYHIDLQRKNYEIYDSLNSAIENSTQPVSHAFSFSVIEHVYDPLEFLQQIYQLMDVGSSLVLSTPNLDDYLISLSLAYKSFFFRKAHRWYFDKTSIANLGSIAGFRNVKVRSHHRFGISNMINWLRFSQPFQNNKADVGFDTKIVDAVWQKSLEDSISGDYLYVTMEK